MYKKLLKAVLVICFISTIMCLIIFYVKNKESSMINNLGGNNDATNSEALYNDYTTQEINPSTNLKSGATAYVPWENNEEFLSNQSKNKTFTMMAAYRTVLRDPLPGEEENVHKAAALLCGTVVTPQKIFSQNNQIGPYTTSKGFKKGPTYLGTKLTTTIGGGVCKIASTIYNVTILSDLSVIERHAHSMPVPYVPYGQDATVSYGVKDFKFKNNTSFPIMIWAQGIENILYIAFYSSSKPPDVEWNHQVIKLIKAGTIYKSNPKLPPGNIKLVLEGMDGAIVKSWVTIKNLDGTIIEKQLGKSFYNPMPHVFEKGK